MNINKAIIYGNLTRDPELRTLPNGTPVASFGVATNRYYTDKDGKKQEQADFHNVVVFGRQAETAHQYLKKGSGAFVEGRLQTRSWEQEGQKKYRTEIVADRIQFGPSGGRPADSPSEAKGDAAADPSAPKGAKVEYPEDDINPDDIPF